MNTKTLVVATILAATVASDAGAARRCDDSCFKAPTTVDQRLCLSAELERAQKELDQLSEAALEEWKFVPSDAPLAAAREQEDEYSRAISDGLQRAQAKWRDFVAADCEAVGATWTSGTGRRGAVLACQLDYVRQRSYYLWLMYLERGTETEAPCKPGTPAT